MLHLQALIDDVTWFETVRNIRWPDGIQCPTCGRSEVTTHGRAETPPARQRYLGQACARHFDELTDTILAGPHPPLRVGRVCLDVMGLTLSHHQRAQELALHSSAGPQMTCQWRPGLVAPQATATLSGEVA
jgi:transposase-like protein